MDIDAIWDIMRVKERDISKDSSACDNPAVNTAVHQVAKERRKYG